MKKFFVYLLVIFVALVVVCFYIGEFMIAYGLIFAAITILTAIGHIYSIDNHIYLDKKRNEYDDRFKHKHWE